MGKLTTTLEAGLKIGKSPEVIRKACREGRLPATKKSERFLIDEDDLIRWASQVGDKWQSQAEEPENRRCSHVQA
jgi:hypothetical protein